VSSDGSVIAWAICEPTSIGCDIYIVQKTTDESWSTPVQLTDSTGEDRLPDTNGQIVAYASDAGGDFDIWWKNIDGTGEQQLTMPGQQFRPTISGNLISFESDTVGTTNGDLFVYDLATEQLYQVTNTPDVDETLNDISVAPDGTVRVVWAQPDGLQLGHFDVYAMSFELGDTTAYEVCPLFEQSRAYRIKSTVPVRLQLCDAQGENLSSQSLVVTATDLVKKDGTASPSLVEDAGNANPDNNFRYDPTLGDTGGYVYNLSTKELSTGTWELRFTVSGDPTTYSVSFDLR
jgi:Tol biopolymer transport system component